jgi:DNA-binding NtrC family response regulator
MNLSTLVDTSGREPVLVSWIAVNNDPFERNRDRSYRLVDGKHVNGPTLALLTDPGSEYAGRITDAVFLRQGGEEAEFHTRVYEELVAALAERCPMLRLHPIVWNGEDPTDHSALFEFLRERLPQVRRKFSGRELVVHVSPGTPSMHTVWVLMAETGFIDAPFRLVKSFRQEDRHQGRPLVNPVHVGIDTFYKRYQETRPRTVSTQDEVIRWDPARFRSEALARVFREAQRVAPLKVPVLILGERGTGKTTLASWIRAASPYRKASLDEAWPAIACGQYTSETMRTELFGYRKGAFTGADRDRDGLLHAANGDTLFLDELGDISHDLQRLLIKAVEEGRFQRLGSTDFETTDFRLITATNLPVSELAQRIDPDFLDRVRAFELRLPPIRDIPEELDWMWDAVLTGAARRAQVNRRYASLPEKERTRLLAALRTHPLPGNIRDLFRVAWRFLAARADDRWPLSPNEAVSYALEALETPADASDESSRMIAQAFAENRPLPAPLLEQGPVQTEDLFVDLRKYLANELRRVSKERKLPITQVADVGERTLRSWARKESSGAPED